MNLIIFIVESILTMAITKIVFKNRIRVIYEFEKRWKYEAVEAVFVISTVIIIFGFFSEQHQFTMGGVILGFIQGMFESALRYKLDE